MYCETFSFPEEIFVKKCLELHMFQHTIMKKKQFREYVNVRTRSQDKKKTFTLKKTKWNGLATKRRPLRQRSAFEVTSRSFEYQESLLPSRWSYIWSYLEKFRVRRVASAVPLKLHLKLSQEFSSKKSRFYRPSKAQIEVISRSFVYEELLLSFCQSSIWSYLEKFGVRRVASAVPLKLH